MNFELTKSVNGFEIIDADANLCYRCNPPFDGGRSYDMPFSESESGLRKASTDGFQRVSSVWNLFFSWDTGTNRVTLKDAMV